METETKVINLRIATSVTTQENKETEVSRMPPMTASTDDVG